VVPAAFVAGVAGAVGLSVARRSPWPAAAVLAPYAAVVGAASRATARQAGASTRTVALATATMHTAYGLGWWAGAARALRRRS
jgi:hypothetical protein